MLEARGQTPVARTGAPAEKAQEYTNGGGAHRVDCHPRIDPKGRQVLFDSPHEGGRQLYLIDISGITRPPPP